MATQASTKRTITSRKVRPNPVVRFKRWFETKDAVAELGEEQTELRGWLVDYLKEYGEKDEKGNLWFDLPEALALKDHDVVGKVGKTHVFTQLKLERHLTPANPTPDPEKAERLLKKKGLYLTDKAIELIAKIQDSCPFVTITIDIDPDAVAKAYFQDRITEKEYDAVLVEQRESFQFRPSEG